MDWKFGGKKSEKNKLKYNDNYKINHFTGQQPNGVHVPVYTKSTENSKIQVGWWVFL